MKTVTLGQKRKIRELLKDTLAEQIQQLLATGFLGDLLKANVGQMNRPKLRLSKDQKMGMAKHRTSGHSVNSFHFTGPKAGKRIRRKGKKGLSHKQRRAKRGKHVNKYAHNVAPK